MDEIEFKDYIMTSVIEIRPYIYGEDMRGIKIDSYINPREDMGVISRDPLNHEDQCYLSRKFFEENFECVQAESEPVDI